MVKRIWQKNSQGDIFWDTYLHSDCIKCKAHKRSFFSKEDKQISIKAKKEATKL